MRFHPVKIGVFGSYARGDDETNSDIDILVNFSKKITLFDLGEIKTGLTDLLKRQVDIVTERALNHKIKPYIFPDLKIIYG